MSNRSKPIGKLKVVGGGGYLGHKLFLYYSKKSFRYCFLVWKILQMKYYQLSQISNGGRNYFRIYHVAMPILFYTIPL